ncbi:hypothetical protein IVB22_39480 [Bradyrhizobium sp. 190]|nr:hypothetical protein [Bradyrhizobium sp. 190]
MLDDDARAAMRYPVANVVAKLGDLRRDPSQQRLDVGEPGFERSLALPAQQIGPIAERRPDVSVRRAENREPGGDQAVHQTATAG